MSTKAIIRRNSIQWHLLDKHFNDRLHYDNWETRHIVDLSDYKKALKKSFFDTFWLILFYPGLLSFYFFFIIPNATFPSDNNSGLEIVCSMASIFIGLILLVTHVLFRIIEGHFIYQDEIDRWKKKLKIKESKDDSDIKVEFK